MSLQVLLSMARGCARRHWCQRPAPAVTFAQRRPRSSLHAWYMTGLARMSAAWRVKTQPIAFWHAPESSFALRSMLSRRHSTSQPSGRPWPAPPEPHAGLDPARRSRSPWHFALSTGFDLKCSMMLSCRRASSSRHSPSIASSYMWSSKQTMALPFPCSTPWQKSRMGFSQAASSGVARMSSVRVSTNWSRRSWQALLRFARCSARHSRISAGRPLNSRQNLFCSALHRLDSVAEDSQCSRCCSLRRSTLDLQSELSILSSCDIRQSTREALPANFRPLSTGTSGHRVLASSLQAASRPGCRRNSSCFSFICAATTSAHSLSMPSAFWFLSRQAHIFPPSICTSGQNFLMAPAQSTMALGFVRMSSAWNLRFANSSSAHSSERLALWSSRQSWTRPPPGCTSAQKSLTSLTHLSYSRGAALTLSASWVM
mmetsp:Transcript_18321/g.51895  ORF Transcript_18321/g.51895 Transcript_18321/m.51895 type:complete len:429 (+) Transcript_18321:500-1786(+)